MSCISKMDSSSSARSFAMRSRLQYPGRRRMAEAAEYFISLFRPIKTLSRTVRLRNRRMFWKVRPMPMWLTSTVLFPSVETPSRRMEPRVGLYTLVSRLKIVVLPAPFGPIRPVISVRPMARLKSATAVRPPKSMPRWRVSRIGGLPMSRSVSRFVYGCGTSLGCGLTHLLLIVCRLLLWIFCASGQPVQERLKAARQ